MSPELKQLLFPLGQKICVPVLVVSPLVLSLVTKSPAVVLAAPSVSLPCFSFLLSSFRIGYAFLEDFKVVVAVVLVKFKTEGLSLLRVNQ